LVTAIDSPFSSEQLIDVTRQLPSDQRISAATVYRTLGEFIDAGILTYSRVGGDRQYTLA
jgi:Fe2+ or Zn2+ uptake regulation protein